LRLHPRSAWISNLAHAGTNMVLATIAFITSRESRQGRPLPSGRRDGAGIMGSTMFHCSSVRSMPLWCNLMKLASSQTRSPVLRSGGPLQ
jgi:hypothetical protein